MVCTSISTVQVLRIRLYEDDEPEKTTNENGVAVEAADEVQFLKRLEKNLLIMQLGGIDGIRKVCIDSRLCMC